MAYSTLAEPSSAHAPADRSPDRAPTDEASGSEFAPLLRTVRGQGLLERRIGWYVRGITVNALILAALVAAVLAVGDTWWTLLLAVPLAVFFARTAFIGHDAGHSQISGSRTTARVIGLVHGNLLLGMSAAWWNDKHNRHHANPNHLEKDPDVKPDVLVFARDHAEGRAGVKGWLTRNQAWLFFPLCLLEGLNLKVSGFRDLRRQAPRERLVEGTLLVTHLAAYATLLLTAMSPGKAIAFALLHQALFGLHLGMAFAPNHKGMEMPDGTGERWGHLRRQVLTSRNIRGSALTDWFLGGLNYQIEHHLFPSMPRPHLRLAQPMVRDHCRTVGIPYTETGVIDSYRQALRHLREVGEPLRVE
ncbi:fatty acid desaturase family protein [Streptomyces monticola]|uniref:Fatty acid desaturase family protein n=1 Tax=Streptomyces monticola TaxID=2666263 RepID=A0ABW2JGF4_9ACTN